MAKVILRNVLKCYAKKTVLSGINLEINDTEFVVLVGPSECGKTTMLRLIAGLEKPNGGQIFIDDNLVNNIDPQDRNVAMVFQDYSLYPHMSVFKNLAFGLEVRKTPKEKIKENVCKAIEMLKLENSKDKKPYQLSGGARQRVAIGKAILLNPSVFLFDEPLSNLDAKFRIELRAEIKKLHQELCNTIIYVTHDQVEAMTLADRIVVMGKACIEQVGTPLEIYRKPKNTYVAEFIGSPPMNLIRAKVINNQLVNSQFKVSVPNKYNLKEKEGMEVIMGLRPEDIMMYTKRHVFSSEYCINGKVELTEPIGCETYVHIDVSGLKLIGKHYGFETLNIGEVQPFGFNLENLYLFDCKSKLAIL